MSDPREGLPPCVSMVRFDDRMATLVDYKVCNHANRERFCAMASRVDDSVRRAFSEWHPEFPLWRALDITINILTDDPDEAQAAFDKGAEWVRTGHIS